MFNGVRVYLGRHLGCGFTDTLCPGGVGFGVLCYRVLGFDGCFDGINWVLSLASVPLCKGQRSRWQEIKGAARLEAPPLRGAL